MSERLSMPPLVPFKDVEWRVDGKPSNSRCRFVPYLGAATAARLLDEWVGPGGWSDTYELEEIGGKAALWCYLSVKVGDEWVTKRDVGVPTQFEPQKGGVSDAFKRAACLKWGVGRNVYTLPTVWAPCKVTTNRKGEEVAWPTDETLPSIHRQLQQMGYEASGKLAGDDVNGTPERNEPKEPTSQGNGKTEVKPSPEPAKASPSPTPTHSRDVTTIEIGGPCPHCGEDVKRWAPKAAPGETQKKPQWLCTNRECPGSPDTQVAPRWFSWHDDPWKEGGEIDQMKSPRPETDEGSEGASTRKDEDAAEHKAAGVSSPSEPESESPESVFNRIEVWREANHVFKRQLFNVAKDVALEMKAREDGRPFHPKDIPSLPVEVLVEIEKRLHAEKAEADAKAAEQESLGVG